MAHLTIVPERLEVVAERNEAEFIQAVTTKPGGNLVRSARRSAFVPDIPLVEDIFFPASQSGILAAFTTSFAINPIVYSR